MNQLVSELTDLLLKFVEGTHHEEGNKVRIPRNYPLVSKDYNLEVARDAVRHLLFIGGMVQEYRIVNGLKEKDAEHFKFEAYDGILKLVNFVLLPSPFPLKYYQKCCIASTVLMEVVDQMSVDLELLNELFAPIVKYDKFVRDLLDISNEVYGPGGRVICDDIRTHVSRSDYFIHLEDLNRDRNTNDSDVGRNNGRNNSDGSGSTSTHLEFCRFCHYDHCLCQFALTSNSQDHPEFKLVEINLGAASVSYHSGKLRNVHSKVLKTSLVDFHEDESKSKQLLTEKEKLHMENDPDTSFNYPVFESHKAYTHKYPPLFGKKKVCVFLITKNNLNNYYDTYFIANDVFEKYGVLVKSVCPKQLTNWIRRKMLFLASEWEYNADGSVNFTKYSCFDTKLKPGRLVLNLDPDFKDFSALNKTNNCYEVSTLYYRDFYDSDLMLTDDLVYLRRFLEFSDTVKIPNSLIQLVNTKRAQMYFSQPENVDRLLSSYNKRVKGVKRNEGFTDLLKQTAVLQVDPSLDSSSETVKDAIANPGRYVLKSNREAGSACTFGKELSERLKECQNNKEELSQYVLMRKILVPKQPGLFVKHLRNGAFEVKGHNSLTELGVYHYALYDGNECKLNETNGYLARTKPDFATGGGVSAGFGYVNTLLFF